MAKLLLLSASPRSRHVEHLLAAQADDHVEETALAATDVGDPATAGHVVDTVAALDLVGAAVATRDVVVLVTRDEVVLPAAAHSRALVTASGAIAAAFRARAAEQP